MTLQTKSRIESIDILRGIVMVIMALDHVRDYFHTNGWTVDPLDLHTTTPFLYFTRYITHFCAPTFVFLSGVSIYLQGLRKTKAQLSAFLLKRGLWLIFVELFIISFAWTFNPHFNTIPLGVIWAIGVSMVCLSLLIWLPYKAILGFGLFLVLCHNILDLPPIATQINPTFLLDLLHNGNWSSYPIGESHRILIAYPFLPWLGLMMMGYCCGLLYSPSFDSEKRKKWLTGMGLGLLVLFVLLRSGNIYGDPEKWTEQRNGLYTFLSLIHIHKYPPSLLYMCVTIGIALLLLPHLESLKNYFSKTMRTFGRTAFFYYILHLYLIHGFAVVLHAAHAKNANIPDSFALPGVYLVWIAVVLCLYPLCKWYDGYKTNHKEKWWLSYL